MGIRDLILNLMKRVSKDTEPLQLPGNHLNTQASATEERNQILFLKSIGI